MPHVSVIVPTYNRGELLRENIESILNQEFADYEIIYVNDGSTDNTSDILAEYVLANPGKLSVVNTENGGPGPARDAGVAVAEGEFIFFTDDDVLVPENWISGMLACREAAGCDVLCGGIESYSMDTPVERCLHYRMQISLGQRKRRISVAPTMDLMLPKELFLKVGGFQNKSMPAAEDWELSYRLETQGAIIYYDPTVSVIHRYQKKWEHAAKRMRETGEWGLYAAHTKYFSVTAYLGYCLLRYLASPVRLLRHYPPELFFLAWRMETVLILARIKAYFLNIIGRNPYKT